MHNKGCSVIIQQRVILTAQTCPSIVASSDPVPSSPMSRLYISPICAPLGFSKPCSLDAGFQCPPADLKSGAFTFSGFMDMYAVRPGRHIFRRDINDQPAITLRRYNFTILLLVCTQQLRTRHITADFTGGLIITAASNGDRLQKRKACKFRKYDWTSHAPWFPIICKFMIAALSRRWNGLF